MSLDRGRENPHRTLWAQIEHAHPILAASATHCTTRGVRTVVQSWQADDRFRRAIMCQQFPESLFEPAQNYS